MILFRADGNSNIGLGHVMRCLSIADAFKKAGEKCLFVTADHGLHNTIVDRGHKNLVLNSNYDHMENELEALKQTIGTEQVNVVFVDSYYVMDSYLKSLGQFCAKRHIMLVYIDDVLAFPYPCDVVLNYNIYANIEDYKHLYRDHSEPDFLLGAAYAPLRAEFQNLSDEPVNHVGKNILISTGGADFEHIGLEIVKTIIVHKEWENYKFHFIVGTMNEDKDEIISLAKGQENIVLYHGVKKMAELMRSCDIAISAAGSTLYELCSTHTPTITYILADNQIPGANGFEEKGVLTSAGDIRILGAGALSEKLLSESIKLVDDYDERCAIASRMKSVVDGKGADRIVQKITELWNMTGR